MTSPQMKRNKKFAHIASQSALPAFQGMNPNISNFLVNNLKYEVETVRFRDSKEELIKKRVSEVGFSHDFSKNKTNIMGVSSFDKNVSTIDKSALTSQKKFLSASLQEGSSPLKQKKKKKLSFYAILMNNLSLTAFKPHELGISFEDVNIIELMGNRFKEIPTEIFKYRNTTVLKLDNNYIKSIGDNFLENFPNLQILSLSDNILQEIPETINLVAPSLFSLNIEKNHISVLPEALSSLTKLKSLKLAQNHFVSIPTGLRKLEDLQEFTLDWFKYVKPILPVSITGSEGKPVLNSLFKLMTIIENEGKGEARCGFMRFAMFFSEQSISHLQQVHTRKKLTYVHIAALNQDIGVLKGLIDMAPCLLDKKDKEGLTPLLLSIREEKYISAKNLILCGADLTSCAGPVGPPLVFATIKMQYYLVHDLLKQGADPNLGDSDGNCPLHMLMNIFSKMKKQAESLAQLLLDNKANPNIQNCDKWSPLHLAVKRNQLEAIKFMLEYNRRTKEEHKQASLFDFNKLGGATFWSPLHIAAHYENFPLIEYLIEGGGDIYQRNIENRSPAQLSSKNLSIIKLFRKKDKDCIRALLDNSPDGKLSNHKYSEGEIDESGMESFLHQKINEINIEVKSRATVTVVEKKVKKFEETPPETDEQSFHDFEEFKSENEAWGGSIIMQNNEKARQIITSSNNLKKLEKFQRLRKQQKQSQTKDFKSLDIRSPRNYLINSTNLRNFIEIVEQTIETIDKEAEQVQKLILSYKESFAERLKGVTKLHYLHHKICLTITELRIHINAFNPKNGELRITMDKSMANLFMEKTDKINKIANKWDLILRTLLFIFENLKSLSSGQDALLKIQIGKLFDAYSYKNSLFFLNKAVLNKDENILLRFDSWQNLRRLKNIQKIEVNDGRILNPINQNSIKKADIEIKSDSEIISSFTKEANAQNEENEDKKILGLVDKENGELNYQRKSIHYMDMNNKKINTTEENVSDSFAVEEKICFNVIENDAAPQHLIDEAE